ncbi:MAG: glycosyl transferase [Bacteroidota bacterium]
MFDSNYLSRGITLYRSLERVCDNFHLYIFAFNEKSLNILRHLQLPHATIISLQEFEDAELLQVKPSRSRAEYCWTSTSSTILFVLEKYHVDMCTYLDADMMFFESPKTLFDEMGNKSVLITEHRYSPRYNKEALSGKYCVQFVSFRNDARGLTVLKWWRDRCIEWCFARFEDGKFGDQKYLDDWTTRFENIHELQHLGGGMAAWNIQQYEVDEKNGKLIGIELRTGHRFPVIFYHYHYLRFLDGDRIELGRRVLSDNVIQKLYVPYLKALEMAKQEINRIDPSFDPHGTSSSPFSWKTPILFLYRKIFGIYHIYSKSRFISSID